MTRRINLSQIGNYSTEKFEQLLRVTVFETDSRLKQGSPVDTGRFRLSWAISETGTPGYDAGPQTGASGITPPRRLDYQVERAGGVYHIHNNLPYAEKLATGAAGSGSKTETRYNPKRNVTTWASPGGGSSIQTGGPGWTDLIAREMTAWARQEADRIGRSD
jgi:hypothetical protein